jgi:hypothetical protein
VILSGTFASLMLGGNSLLSRWASRSRSDLRGGVRDGDVLHAGMTALIGHAAWWPATATRRGSREAGQSV